MNIHKKKRWYFVITFVKSVLYIKSLGKTPYKWWFLKLKSYINFGYKVHQNVVYINTHSQDTTNSAHSNNGSWEQFYQR